MRTFGEFLTKRDRDNREHLKILGHILDRAGFKVKPHLDETHDPCIYIKKPLEIDPALEDLSFGGIRIYARGKDIICFRAQMRDDAEPYGETYQLDVAGMYKDMMDENHEKLPYLIIYHLIKQITDFFITSAKAEMDSGENSDALGSIIGGETGTDYGSTVAQDVKRN
jgi:hypothetical protein